jgi:hypothetical protein
MYTFTFYSTLSLLPCRLLRYIRFLLCLANIPAFNGLTLMVTTIVQIYFQHPMGIVIMREYCTYLNVWCMETPVALVFPRRCSNPSLHAPASWYLPPCPLQKVKVRDTSNGWSELFSMVQTKAEQGKLLSWINEGESWKRIYWGTHMSVRRWRSETPLA